MNQLVWFFLGCVSIALNSVALADGNGYTITQKMVPQPLNHDFPVGSKLQERVTILIPDGVSKDAPVFFVLGNEAAAGAPELVKIYDIYKSQMIFIEAEHRGYGISVSDDEDQSVPKYVSVHQAVADYHDVVKSLKKDFTGPWIGAGWSYSGGLVLQHAESYPNDFKAILSSSGVVRHPMIQTYYDQRVRETLGHTFYDRLAKHIHNLQPNACFDDIWMQREFLINIIRGLTQYAQYARMLPIAKAASLLPTQQFIGSLKTLDQQFAGGTAWSMAQGLGKETLTHEEAVTGDYGWRVYHYQECTEFGSFDVNAGSTGIFDRTSDDYLNECRLMFGREISFPFATEWNPLEQISSIKIPIIYVAGGKDPWFSPGVPPDTKFNKGSYHFISDGQHCPDRNDPKLVKQILDELTSGIQN